MFGNMGNMLKQAQMAQERMQRAQDEIEKFEATGESSRSLVKVVMTGAYDIKKVELADEVFELGDKEMIEDLTTAAIADAVQRIK